MKKTKQDWIKEFTKDNSGRLIYDRLHICDKCEKEIKGWGIDGCPVVAKGNEIGVIFGMVSGWRHYNC